MENTESDNPARYANYWNAEGRVTSRDRLRPTVFFVLGLQFAFTGLDRWAYPEHFEFFTAMRMVVNVYLVAILLRFRFTQPRLSQIGICFGVGAEILAMVYTDNGANSYYYAGLILVMVGAPVLMPFRAIDSLLTSSLICIGFAVSPWFIDTDVNTRHFTIALVFLLSGGVEGVLSCYLLDQARILDFERRSELEAARDDLKTLDELKARLTSNIHHELRTPLTLILAPLEAMIGGDYGKLPAAARKTLITMENNGQRLLTVVSNLLDLAKLEGNSFKIERRRGDFVHHVREIVSGAEPLAEKKGVTLGFECVGDSQPIFADWDAVDKVVLNLLGNALKFTEAGGTVDFRIDAMSNPVDEGANTDRLPGVLLSVVDSGIGIAKDQVDKIFDRFAQVDGSATRQHEGTGIGLALVQELVELHDGQVWAESEGLGHGTTLSVWLPAGNADVSEESGEIAGGTRRRSLEDSMAATQAELHLQISAGEDGDDGDGEEHASSLNFEVDDPVDEDVPLIAPEDRPHLVVADDNPDMRDLLNFILGREFNIRTACNGREALDLIREARPDAVLTDLMMPEMTGIDLVTELRGDDTTRTLPVILITSTAEQKIKIEGLEIGADDYVTKPFHPKELLARVRSLVRVGVLQNELSARNEVLEETLAELRRTQKHLILNERRAAAGEIAGGIAHEVNNPVNFALNAARAMKANIEGLTEVTSALENLDWTDEHALQSQLRALRELHTRVDGAELASVLAELAQIIRDGLDRTHRLVADLRDLVVPGEGEYTSVDVMANIKSALQLVNHQLEGSEICLSVDWDESLPPAKANSNALNQILVNLIKNAADELPARTGEIRIAGHQHGDVLRILVEDNGQGVSAELADRIFEPFVTTKDPGQGTGLGLSVCRQIAESHGGSLELLPSTGDGATFCLELPVAEDQEKSDEDVPPNLS